MAEQDPPNRLKIAPTVHKGRWYAVQPNDPEWHKDNPEYLLAPIEISLGQGDKLVSSIFNEEEGWAGFCISDSDRPVGIGEVIEQPDGTTDNSLGAYFRLITKNPRALDVVIDNCERAKTYLAEMAKKEEGQ